MSRPLWSNLATRITALSSDPICGLYRFEIPLRALTSRSWCSASIFSAADSNFVFSPSYPVLTQRHVGLDHHTRTLMRDNGSRLVHDIDDLLWAIPADNPNVHALPPELLRRINVALHSADLVTTSTEPLAAALATGGIRSVVVPNLLDPTQWPISPRDSDRKRLRVGWYGQRNVHDEDIKILESVVRGLAGEVDFVFYGDVPHGLTSRESEFEFHPATSIRFFPTMLATLDLDILLSPLALNQFNACKSNLRLLQAGMLGYAVIATDIEPHRTLPVTLVSNDPRAWIRAIQERIGEREAVRAEGLALRKAVETNYMINDAWATRIYENWVGRSLVDASST